MWREGYQSKGDEGTHGTATQREFERVLFVVQQQFGQKEITAKNIPLEKFVSSSSSKCKKRIFLKIENWSLISEYQLCHSFGGSIRK